MDSFEIVGKQHSSPIVKRKPFLLCLSKLSILVCLAAKYHGSAYDSPPFPPPPLSK